MPYYCTVPLCTSMAGKAKNVSFHQFPRDEELAKLWNEILKRGKPYTKYSKVCSLHFRPEDYTITSVGKNKGQWRTLRKDAIPSQNLPFETPIPTSWLGKRAQRNVAANVVDPLIQHQMAQAIYIQTMLAMQAATNDSTPPLPSVDPPKPNDKTTTSNSTISISELQIALQKHAHRNTHEPRNVQKDIQEDRKKVTSFKCDQCSKCFKDPDVLILHKRIHTSKNPEIPERLPDQLTTNEKENYHGNNDISRQETLRANPILANLLRASDVQGVPNFDLNILSIENQIMTALSVNMESYIRNLSCMILNQKENDERNRDIQDDDETSPESENSEQNSVQGDTNYADCYQNFLQDRQNYLESQCLIQDRYSKAHKIRNLLQPNKDLRQESLESTEERSKLIKENESFGHDDQNDFGECNISAQGQTIIEESQNMIKDDHNSVENQGSLDLEPNCDNKDFDESKDSNNLIIDENV